MTQSPGSGKTDKMLGVAAPNTKNIAATLGWLPPLAQSRQSLFTYLQEKSGHSGMLTLPTYPRDNVLPWFFEGYRRAGNEPKALYSLIYRDLLVAQQLLDTKAANSQKVVVQNTQQRRLGLRLAYYSSFWAAERLADAPLRVRIYETFLLPNLDAAYSESWHDLSRLAMLRRACAAYKQTGEIKKQLTVLRLVIQLADNPNTADWGRIKLAEALVSQNEPAATAAAIEALKAVRTPEMSGSKQLIPELQQKLDAQRKSAPHVPQKTDGAAPLAQPKSNG